MGAADVVPGVSGGTIAFITGIYDELLDAIKSFDGVFFRQFFTGRMRPALSRVPWGFLLPLLCGIGISVFSLARLVLALLENEPVLVWGFFTGLILASMFMLVLDMRRNAEPGDTRIAVLFFAAGCALALAVSFSPRAVAGDSLAGLFFSGFIALCAMILPGVSGAFMLVLLGRYEMVLSAVSALDIPLLAVFGAGGIAGLLSFARFLSFCLRRFRPQTLAFLTGMIGGSLPVVWPFKNGGLPALPSSAGECAAAAVLAAMGMALPLVLHRLGTAMQDRQGRSADAETGGHQQ